MILKYMGFSCEIDDMSQVNCDANVAMQDAREENGDVVNMSRALYLTTWHSNLEYLTIGENKKLIEKACPTFLHQSRTSV